jgi:hypothetical protein
LPDGGCVDRPWQRGEVGTEIAERLIPSTEAPIAVTTVTNELRLARIHLDGAIELRDGLGALPTHGKAPRVLRHSACLVRLRVSDGRSEEPPQE